MNKIIALAIAGLISVALTTPALAQNNPSDTAEVQKENTRKEAKQKKKDKHKKKEKKAKKKSQTNPENTNTVPSEPKKD